MEYLKELMDKKVTTPDLVTGGDDTRSIGQRLRDAGEWLPGTGDVISGYDAWEAFKKGNYGEAGLNALGVIPLVPAFGGVIRKSSESMVPKSSYTEDVDYSHLGSKEEELVHKSLDSMHQKWAKNAGSELDPMYKLMEEGKINGLNYDDLIGSQSGQLMAQNKEDFMGRLEMLGGYGGQYDRLPSWQKMLEDWRENVDLPSPQGGSGARRVQNLYDRELLGEVPHEWDYYGDEPSRFVSKMDAEEGALAGELTSKEQKFFDKLGDYDLVGNQLNRFDYPIFGNAGQEALMHALTKGNITPSTLADNRISLPSLIDFIQQHKDFVKAEGAKVPPEDILNTFESGHRWEELKKPEQLQFEGDKMSNCIGGYCDKVDKGDARIFSLRNAEGTPKVSVEWDPRTRSFPQIFGPGNSQPKDKYREMIDWLIEKSIDW